MGSIPALSYTIRQSSDRLYRQHRYYEEEILQSRKLVFGHPDYSISSYGIVTDVDPVGATDGSSDPLAVSTNSTDELTVDVNAGICVFLSGVWIELHAKQFQISLDDTSVGIPNVVYIQYTLEPGPQQLNDYNDLVTTYTQRINDEIEDGLTTAVEDEAVMIKTLSVSAYQALSDTVKEDTVPLAIVTVQREIDSVGNTTNSLSIDHTQATYAFNRPWYSPVDIEHRSSVGTGVVTAGNPHGTALDDLSVGNFTIMQLHTDAGMIVAEDKSVPKVPGYRCTSTITTINTDDASGTLTGYPLANYIELPYFPVQVGLITDVAGSENLAGVQVPETNRIVFPYETVAPGTSLRVYYTRVEACEPPLPGNVSFTTSGPTTSELIVSGGSGYSALSTTTETMGDAGLFPMRYDFYVNPDGNVVKTPQIVYCLKSLDNIGTTDTADITFNGPGRLILGLKGDSDLAGMSIKIRVYGKDPEGVDINYLFQFTQANWNDLPPLPSAVFPSNSVQSSNNVFASITSISIEERLNSGAGAQIMIWCVQTPYNSYDTMSDACYIASCMWDGYSLAQVYDKRIINTTVRSELNAFAEMNNLELITRALAGGSGTIYAEDFRRPRYASMIAEDQMLVNLPVAQMSKLQVGLQGVYSSVMFPVNTSVSSNYWRITFLGLRNIVDPLFIRIVNLVWYDGAVQNSTVMTPVAGDPTTYEATLTATPTKVQVGLTYIQADAMVLYG